MRTRWTHVKFTLNFPSWLPLLHTNSNKLYRQIMCTFHVWLYFISLKRTQRSRLAQFLLVACNAFNTNVCQCVRACACTLHTFTTITWWTQLECAKFHLLLNHYIHAYTFSIPPAGIFALLAILWKRLTQSHKSISFSASAEFHIY